MQQDTYYGKSIFQLMLDLMPRDDFVLVLSDEDRALLMEMNDNGASFQELVAVIQERTEAQS